MAKDLTNVYVIDEEKGIITHTTKAHGKYYKGIAKTNFEAGDTFDVEKGKRIAKLRAILKMKKDQIKGIMDDYHYCLEMADLCDTIQANLQKQVEVYNKIEEKLMKILEVEPAVEELSIVDMTKK